MIVRWKMRSLVNGNRKRSESCYRYQDMHLDQYHVSFGLDVGPGLELGA